MSMMVRGKEVKKLAKNTSKKSRLEIRHAEIIKPLQTTFGPLPDNYSLAQPSPFKSIKSAVVYSAYEEPIMA